MLPVARRSGEVRGGQPDLCNCARGSGAGRVVHLWPRRRAGHAGVLRHWPRRRVRINSRISQCVPPNSSRPGHSTIACREPLVPPGRIPPRSRPGRRDRRCATAADPPGSSRWTSVWRTVTTSTSPCSGTLLPFMARAPDLGPAARAAAATRFFIGYVQRQVFDPVGVKDATRAPVRNALLMYPPPYAGTAPGRPGPGGAIGVLRGRLVHDTGQHAPGTRWPHQRQPAARPATAADGRQLSRLGLLRHRPSRLPGQGRRHRRPGLSGPSDLLRHPRGDDPCGGAISSNGPPLETVVHTALLAATSAR